MSAIRNELPQLQPFFKERTPIKETPSEKYKAYHKFIHSNGFAKLPRIYFTTTITSGGFNVFAEKEKPKSDGDSNPNFLSLVTRDGLIKKTSLPTTLSFSEILDGNTKLAEAFRIALLDSGRVSTEKNLLIFPPDLGKVPGWTQFDFNLFWLNIISGVHPDDANKIEVAFNQILIWKHIITENYPMKLERMFI